MNKQSKKIRFSLIDFLLVLVILGALVSIFMRSEIIRLIGADQNRQTAEISFLVEGVSPGVFDYLNDGDTFTDDTHECLLGAVTGAPTKMPAEIYETALDGTIHKLNSEEKIDIRGKLEAVGTFSEEGFLLGGIYYLAPGSEITVHSERLTLTMLVTAIEKGE